MTYPTKEALAEDPLQVKPVLDALSEEQHGVDELDLRRDDLHRKTNRRPNKTRNGSPRR
ncbi:MAG: hypothetical protein MZU97_24320 [Bacillus subtilis]|nr:hypothetical protein [Bacillus subtilis]